MEGEKHSGSVAASRTGALDESAHSEPVPMKNRMAVYQAAVSKQDRAGFSSLVMEEAEVCSLPGGLASIRRQFENEGMSSSHTVTQIHHTHRSVQEVSNSSVMSVASSSGGRQVSQQVFLQDERAARDQIPPDREVISSYENHHNETEEEEYYPRLSTKELAQHFEKTIEEAAPSKKIKIRVPKSEMCVVCKKRVYPMEGLIANKKKFHKCCFFCEHCNNKLSLGNFVSLHGHLYCQPHYKQLFKSKGNFEDGFGQGLQRELLGVRDAGNTDHDALDCRYSLSQSSMCSLSDVFEEANKPDQSPNKISVAWPPQTASPKKTFSLDQDVKLVKPVWPPKSETSKSPKYQRRKATQRSTL